MNVNELTKAIKEDFCQSEMFDKEFRIEPIPYSKIRDTLVADKFDVV